MLQIKSTSSGFTLIELLVAIAIIGILAGVVLISLNSTRENTKYAAAQSELREISQAIVTAQIASGRTLLQMTGNACSGCACRETNGGVQSTACLNNWEQARAAVTVAGGGANSLSDITDFETDPWGSPYILDENEGEVPTNRCRRDNITSAGADRTHVTTDDIRIELPFNSSSCY